MTNQEDILLTFTWSLTLDTPEGAPRVSFQPLNPPVGAPRALCDKCITGMSNDYLRLSGQERKEKIR